MMVTLPTMPYGTRYGLPDQINHTKIKDLLVLEIQIAITAVSSKIQFLPLNWITDNRINRYYCNQTLLVPHYLNSTQNTSVNWIIRILLSLLYCPKVNLLGGGHCTLKMSFLLQVWRSHLILLTDSVRIRSWRVKALNSANRAEGVLRPVRVERIRRQLLLHWKQK